MALGRIEIFPLFTEILKKYILYISRIVDIYTTALLKIYNIHQQLHPKKLSDPNNSASQF